MTMNFKDIVAAAAATGPNMTEAVASGGSYTPPAAGVARLRFVEYIELGVHEETVKGEKKKSERVQLTFELSGPKYVPEEGQSPMTISFRLPLSLNEKANFYKLFTRMNYKGTATHMAELLGEDFLGTIVHNEVGTGADKKVYANLRNNDGFTIRAPFVDAMNDETGDIEQKRVTADPVRVPVKCFIWALAGDPKFGKPMWDSIFIDGSWPDRKDEKTGEVTPGKSKNWVQEVIRRALNFKGSDLEAIAGGGGGEVDIPDAETPARSEAPPEDNGASDDPLNGI